MKKQISKLIDVKSIITIAFTILFFVLAIKGMIESDKVVNIYQIIIVFYFGTQAQKVSDLIENLKEKSNNAEIEEKTKK